MRQLLIILMAVLTLVPWARGQDGIEIEATVSPAQAYLGSTFTYTVNVQVIGQYDIGEPTLDLPASVRSLGLSSNSTRSGPARVRHPDGTTRIANVTTQSFGYTLSADAVGHVTIPPARVLVNGKSVWTNAVEIEVIEPDEIEGFELEARLSKPRAYVGEPVTLRVTWYAADNVRSFSVASSLPGGLEAQGINPPAAARDPSQYPRAVIFGQQVYGQVRQVTRAGRSVAAVTFEMQVRPTATGTYDFGSLAIVFDTAQGFNSRRGISRAEPVSFEALPLPTQGRPADFTGLIGNYRISATAGPTEVSVGDPIGLRIAVTGTDPLSVQAGPRLAADPAFAERFKLDPSGWERDLTGREEARFQTTIRALSPDVREIPPVRLPYFDADAGVYRVAMSEPVPITVHAASNVTLADAVTSSILAPSVREKLGTPSTGLWSIAPPTTLASGRPEPLLRRVLPIVLVVPPLLLGGHVGWTLQRRRGSSRQAAFHRAQAAATRLARRGRHEEAVRTLLSARLCQLPASITAADCLRATDDPQAARTLENCLRAREFARFGGTPPAEAVSTTELLGALRRVHFAEGGRA
ncbi:MAG: BatD family protein [Phycisphaerales bacterium]|nr:BatD family protein [Phycisphaerales bacterium]